MKGPYEALYRRRTFGIKPGLDGERALLAALGHPENAFAVIHVAGTNGKGSVCALLAKVLQETGIRVGLYTSPHLVDLNERFRVDGISIADADLAGLLETVAGAADQVEQEQGREITFFECTTAMALSYFSSAGVQVAVLETGMGGRLDATNVVTPVLGVITRIGLDHAAYLGDTLEAIAHEKGGIVKPACPVIAGRMPDVARRVIRDICAEHSAPLVCAEDAVSFSGARTTIGGTRVICETPEQSYGSIRLALVGMHQVENLATAIAAYEQFCLVAGVGPVAEAVKRACRAVVWPGRAQVLSEDPPVILDGAHNADGGRAVSALLRDVCRGKPLGMVLGMCRDKDAEGFLRCFGRNVATAWAVPLENERGMAAEDLYALTTAQGWTTHVASVVDALRESRAWAEKANGVVCICGSLFLAGEVLALIEEKNLYHG